MSPIYRDVLMVEDDDTFARVVSRNLTSRGVLVRRAASAAEACAQIRERRPDLVLLDINLPDRTGWDVLRECRDGGPLATIVLSATALSRERLAEFKPVAFLPKPFPLDVLLRLVVGEPVEAAAS
jgi:DNA-binding response OmpR family regulator